MTGVQPSGWEALDPFEKARQWHEVDPDIAKDILKLARQHAAQQLKLERDRLLAEDKSRAFDQEQAAARDEHLRRMDVLYWRTHLVATIGGLICIAGLIVVGWRYADTGNVAAGLAVFSLGAGLIAGIYGVGHVMRKRASDASPGNTSTSAAVEPPTA